MASWYVLASGPSMSQALADSLRDQQVIVVSNCYELAPWAHALVSQDAAWWRQHPQALQFAGRKFSTNNVEGVEQFDPRAQTGNNFGTGCNSGLLACMVAQWLGATRLYLHGFDLRGAHYFGEHPAPLKNPNAKRFELMREEFRQWHHAGIEVINATPGSALTCFPRGVA